MADRRRKDVDWYVADATGAMYYGKADLAVLMDIRDELKRLNYLLHCSNFTAIPRVLRGIRANTSKRRPKIARVLVHRKAVRRSRAA